MHKVGFMGGKFLPFHLGHLFAILEAHNQVDKLYIILSSSKKRDKELCERDGIKYIPADVRMSWLGEAFNDLENIEVIDIEDDQWDNDYDWTEGARMITGAIPEKITHVFSSEHTYTELFKQFYPFAEHVVVDDERKTVTISATELRQNLFDNWDKLPIFVRSFFTKKVLVTGTESVGKSTLVTKLAKFFNTNFVHEVGRDYCERYKNHLTVPMFDSIAMEHFLLQEKLAPHSDKVLFVDSDAIVTKYYLNMYFGATSAFIDELIKLQSFDLCLYLEPDVKWMPDGFRFAGDTQERLKNNELLKQLYIDNWSSDFPTIHISGDYSNRLLVARQEVNKLFK